jgi:hypothetical protein
MFSGFSTTGATNDGAEQADQAGPGGMATVIFSAVEQWTLGAGVLPKWLKNVELGR